MFERIRAAWKVLRGEWVAQPRLQFPSAWIISNNTARWSAPPQSWISDTRPTYTGGDKR